MVVGTHRFWYIFEFGVEKGEWRLASSLELCRMVLIWPSGKGVRFYLSWDQFHSGWWSGWEKYIRKMVNSRELPLSFCDGKFRRGEMQKVRGRTFKTFRCLFWYNFDIFTIWENSRRLFRFFEESSFFFVLETSNWTTCWHIWLGGQQVEIAARVVV